VRALGLVVLAACAGFGTHASAPAQLDCTPSTDAPLLRGVVTDAKTHATVQTSVMLKSACTKAQPRYAVTDDHGAYFFAELPSDTYDVFVAGSLQTTPARIRVQGSAEMTVNVIIERN
jgi:hypothetical protein